MTDSTTRKKKLIEVALPLDEINAACKADKDRKTGTLRNIHKWFAPMPLPAWRALLFAALVDDPEDDNQRVYLLDLIKRLVTNGAGLPSRTDLAEARAVLQRQYPAGLPAVLDPFCGGGSTLVEAQRLGLDSFGSDLNPVPVLISRVLTQLLPPLHGAPSIHQPVDGSLLSTAGTSHGYDGFEVDLRHYATLVENEVERSLAAIYPGAESSVSSWLWARTATCPNPVCGLENPLATSWWLSKRSGNLAWIAPEVTDGSVHLAVVQGKATGQAPPPPKASRGAAFTCIGCGGTISERDLEAQTLGLRLTAVVEDERGRRTFRPPTPEEESQAAHVMPDIGPIPDVPVGDGGTRRRFGLTNQADLYTPRQLATLSTFADRVAELVDKVVSDGGSPEYARAIVSVLGLAVGRLANGGSSQTRWKFDSRSGSAKPEAAFGRNDLPFTWDFVEVNPFSGGSWSWRQCIDTMVDALAYVPAGNGTVEKVDARSTRLQTPGLVATDPPYFDAIGYADLSDFFYVWHRRALREVHPDLYATIATPKQGELTAIASHHENSREAARNYFTSGFTETFRNLQRSMHQDLPLLVVYASREQKGAADEATRWSSILTAMIAADLEITGTWPIHGTGSTRMVGQGTNAVASYIVMACRPRAIQAGTTSLSDFNRALRRELGPAVRDLQAASILPVDLAQAAMGPGMQIFSRYRSVLDQAGRSVEVDQALRLINQALAEVLDEQEGELDRESRFAVRWWNTFGWDAAPFGEADKAVRPLGIGVDDVVRAQIATSQANKVQLIGSAALDRRWTPDRDSLPTAWEAVHHLADRLIDGGGELEAAKLMGRLGSLQDSTMALAYRLHDIAAKKGRTADQERYNALINSWAELVRLSGDGAATMEELF